MNSEENEVVDMTTEECKEKVCDMIKSIADSEMVFYLFGFIKSMIE